MAASPEPLDILRQRFGRERFLPGQLEVIERLLAGRSALAIFPTGGGKSLCFQLPSIALEGITLVVSPLIALMKDQVDALQRAGVAAARLDSTLDRAEVFAIYDRLAAGDLRLLYVAPERLANERFLGRMRQLTIALLAIDEAHCISEWGHNFRPDYLKLAELARELQVERVLALTATATPAVARDIKAALDIADADEVRTPFHRPNLHLRVLRTTAAARPALLSERLRTSAPGPTIVYVTLQRTAESVAAELARQGWRARAYHAGMEDAVRHAVQDAFMAGTCDVVVATIAFGMGIDKADIRRIVHYNLPKTLENYTQEIGRAGRDGANATCELLAVADDLVPLANFSYGDTPSAVAVRALTDELLTLGDTFDVSQYDLSIRHDIRPLVVATTLTYLELDGVVRATGPFYGEYRLRFLRPESELVGSLDDRRSRYIATILGCARRARVWSTIDFAEAAAATDGDRDRVVRALDWLDQQGWVEVRTAGLRHTYRRLQTVAPDAIAAGLIRRFQEREAQDLARLAEVVGYVNTRTCRTAHLLAHFGEVLGAELGGRCGHCSPCDGTDEGPPVTVASPSLDAAEQRTVGEVIERRHGALADPRALTRFLCGLSSPAASRARLGRDAAFGALGHRPFGQVLKAAEAILAGAEP